jgi:hypothetical protein
MTRCVAETHSAALHVLYQTLVSQRNGESPVVYLGYLDCNLVTGDASEAPATAHGLRVIKSNLILPLNTNLKREVWFKSVHLGQSDRRRCPPSVHPAKHAVRDRVADSQERSWTEAGKSTIRP